MKLLDTITANYEDEEILKADGFDAAIIGIELPSMRLIYSVKKCIKILMKDMSYEDAVEHFEFNVSGAYVGEQTPIWCHDDFL
jgi:hypothetical protein